MRQEVAVLGRENPKPELDWADRAVIRRLGPAAPQTLGDEPAGHPGHAAALAPATDRLAPDLSPPCGRLAGLIRQMARENAGWCYQRTQGELPGLEIQPERAERRGGEVSQIRCDDGTRTATIRRRGGISLAGGSLR